MSDASAQDVQKQTGTVGPTPGCCAKTGEAINGKHEWLFLSQNGGRSNCRSVGQVSVLVRPHTINLLVEDESPSFTFDPLGRLHGAFIAGLNYRRSLDDRVLCK